MAEHKDITDPNLHEPLGASTASSGQVYVADGSGSGDWTTPKISYVNVCTRLEDISTAATTYVAAPIAGTIDKIYTCLQGAITGADSNITFQINGVAITSSTITVAQSGSAAGDVDSSSPSAAKTVVAGDKIAVITDGASTGTAILHVQLVITVT